MCEYFGIYIQWFHIPKARMFSGLSWKHNMQSKTNSLTDFCNSKCQSHFTALFIIAQTKKSIAEKHDCTIYNAHPTRPDWDNVNDTFTKAKLCWRQQLQIHRKSMHVSPTTIANYQERSHAHSNFHAQKISEWSFRRFTYGNLVTTSPSSKW